jgi:hypothetical protein
MLEEGEVSAEMKRLRTDLAAMIGRIEVSLKNPSIVPLEDQSILTPCFFTECHESVRAVPAATRGDGPGAGGE